jgi:hypothetical protein
LGWVETLLKSQRANYSDLCSSFFQDFKRAGISRLKEKGREQFWPKKGKEKLEKWTEFTTFRVNKMFSHKFSHLRHFRWLPDGAGIINYQ